MSTIKIKKTDKKMKLIIGKTKPKKEKVLNNYTDDYSDEELEAMSKEANSIDNLDQSDSYEETEETMKEVNEIPEDIKKEAEEEADIKKAVNDVVVFDEVGINMSYVYKFTELYPKKKIVYHNFITKQFLEWYIKTAKVPFLKKLFITDSEYVNPEQQKEISKKIDKRILQLQKKEEIEITDDEKPIVENGAGLRWELETEEQIKAYEFLLTEKWNANERAKGIQQLDAIIEEQMRVKECDLDQAFKNILENFGLQSKFSIESKLKKLEPNKDSNAEVSKELDRSIKRFHDIKFLYELMGSPKMELVKDLNDEEIKHIEKIDELLNSTAIVYGKEVKFLDPAKKKKTTESMNSFIEEGK